ncbi:hypothetical protein UT300012_33030 [Paraclostridium bifermentans]
MDIKELQKAINAEINKNINLDCCNGKHKFAPIGNGTLDVKCINCGIKAMRAVAKSKIK